MELKSNIKNYKNILHNLYKELIDHKESIHFMEQINNKIAESYTDIIRDPMYLKWINERLNKDYYKKIKEIFIDYQKIWNNCRAYHQQKSVFFKISDRIEKKFFILISKYFNKKFKDDLLKYFIKKKIYFNDNNKSSAKLLNNYYNSFNSDIIKEKESNTKKIKEEITKKIKKLKGNELKYCLLNLIEISPNSFIKVNYDDIKISFENDLAKLEEINRSLTII